MTSLTNFVLGLGGIRLELAQINSFQRCNSSHCGIGVNKVLRFG